MSIRIDQVRNALQHFDFKTLFVEELGWNQPQSQNPESFAIDDQTLKRRYIAQLAGVPVIEIQTAGARIPDRKKRLAVHKEISKLHHENLLIFVDGKRTQSLWYWIKREDGKRQPREHYFSIGQPGDLLISKLGDMFFDISDLDEDGNVDVLDVAKRLKDALDIEKVTKRFYKDFSEHQFAFIDAIEGVPDEHDRTWYASVLLNRLMFVYFLQRKGFIDGGDLQYLQSKLAQHRESGEERSFFRSFLRLLFFEGFAKPESERPDEAKARLGKIRYLNGGLFLPHPIENHYPDLDVRDEAFENLLTLFSKYSWNLDDTPGGNDNEINPDVLGYIFEKYVNQKAFGAYYTRTEITEYLCERTIHRLILDAVNTSSEQIKTLPGHWKTYAFENVPEMLMDLDAAICKRLLLDVLPDLSLLDPACGSGAFLVAAMKTLIEIYSSVIGRIEFLGSPELSQWLDNVKREHTSIAYFIKKRIITDNLYGVDIMEEAVEIAKLRLFLALVATATNVDQLEPLPNIDFNLISGNSLIGLLRVNDEEFKNHAARGDLFRKSYKEILAEKNRLVDTYRHATSYAENLSALRESIQQKRKGALETLNEILGDEFSKLGVKSQQPTWDAAKGKEGRAKRRLVTQDDIEQLQPFHWGYEFDQTLNRKGGFDAIITNPPWEIFKPNAKEFFAQYSNVVTKKKMSIHEFKREKQRLLEDPDIRAAWLDYLSQYPHVSSYFRVAKQYVNQTSIVNEKKAGSDLNLYKLFTEQCFNLLREGGLCGIVIPSGIYTDLGTKQLREMFFCQTEITGLFCFENRKAIFEDVHRSFKFVVLTFRKGGQTKSFPAAFMRHDVKELARFPRQGAIEIPVDLVKRLSPDSLSVMEFKDKIDIQIAEKMLQFPLLGESIGGAWELSLTREFDMTNDSHLFKTEPSDGRLPLYEGKMVWHFDHRFAEPRYWVDEKEGRAAVLGHAGDHGQTLDYQHYRLGFRAVASNTNERSLVCSLVPKRVFCGNSLLVSKNRQPAGGELLALAATLNSFVLDAMLRSKVTTNINMFFIYQLPVPRLTARDEAFNPIVERAARLACISPEFDELAREVGLRDHRDAETDPVKRAQLRAELDGLVAHLYNLTEEEFAHILGTFPLVDGSVRTDALQAFRELAASLEKPEILKRISKGESATQEFKATARWDTRENRRNKELDRVIVKTVAGFLNSEQGGTLLIGVDDDGSIYGLEKDYATLGKHPDRDGFENWLTSLLLGEFGNHCSPLIHIAFHTIDGKDVCAVSVKPNSKLCYVQEGNDHALYLRTGNSTRRLDAREAIEYAQQRWGD